ncbi:DivIVA domain-containing protein [Saccharothrix ecbatanensis]|uniref:Cell wall synthesis protein Wag31 n=1 Tax=Saccharothrix ecbatanensis TaxID=1105145 RepID=A0A7W9M4W3_9PSEU|nr:DivIVA domain-containing protein [Saccharothrix ecbatanensis]MBB5807552.1 DivIVA domain-containing protein [Saccharothrix ecbatanensis]
MTGFDARTHLPAHPAPLLGAQDLRQVAFHRPPPGRPGYDEGQVDSFLDRIEETLLGRDNVSEHDVRTVRFRPGRPGYHAIEVDAFMDLVADTLGSTPQRQQASAPAQGAHATSTGMRPAAAGLTPQDVRAVRFHKPRPGNRGYHEGEIDAFLDRIENTLAGRDHLTAQQVQDHEFSYAPPGQIGYDEDDVDTFLDLVVVTLERSPLVALERPVAVLPPVRPRPGPGTRPLTARDVRTAAFGKPPRGRRGYHETQVDKFLDRIENTLLGQDDLSAREVREARFSRPMFGRRGYDETEVDAFLARVEKQLVDDPPRPGSLRPVSLPPVTSWKQLRLIKIPVAGPAQCGYRTSQVDRMLEEVGIALDGMVGASSAEVAEMKFATSLIAGQGYDCAFVDELMPLLVTELRRRGR